MSGRWKTVLSFRPAAVSAPHLPDGFRVSRHVGWTLAAALPFGAASASFHVARGAGVQLATVLAVACGAALAVELTFAAVRGRALTFGWLLHGLLLALILPADTALWHVALGAAFGELFGCQVFGGTGHQLFSPPLVGKCFLMIAYGVVGPSVAWSAGWVEPTVLMAATAVGAVVLVLTRTISLDTLFAVLAPAAAACGLLHVLGGGQMHFARSAAAGVGFAFTACLMTTDRVTSPGTALGRWIYGVLVAAITIVIHLFGSVGDPILFATLIGNLFAPTIDLATRGRQKAEGVETA